VFSALSGMCWQRQDNKSIRNAWPLACKLGFAIKKLPMRSNQRQTHHELPCGFFSRQAIHRFKRNTS